MKKQSISINIHKLPRASEKGYIDLELIYNKEEKKKEGETWELWNIGFVATKAPKGEKGEILGNISEFRNKEKKEEPNEEPNLDDIMDGGIDPDNIPF